MSLSTGKGDFHSVVSHPAADWLTNGLPCNFGRTSSAGVDLECRKRPDGAIEVIASEQGISVTLSGRTTTAAGSVAVDVKWDNGTITLALEGVVVDTRTVRKVP